VGSDSYYDILGVSPGATTDEIKASYRDLSHRIHPDHAGPVALFRQVQQAYEVLSDPTRRAAYDRLLRERLRTGDAGSKSNRARARNGSSRSAPKRTAARSQKSHLPPHVITSTVTRHPAASVAVAGVLLLLFGAALGVVGAALISLGVAALIIAGVASLGARGSREREAYRRSGMQAIDAMNGRQFELLLEHLFANRGYRVGRIGGRGAHGADLLLNDAHEKVIVQARRRTSPVSHELVQHAVASKARYGVDRALVVTSSDYSRDAIAVANSNGVTLWNRATLAAELTLLRGNSFQSGLRRLSSEFRAGSRILLGFFAAAFVALVAVGRRTGRRTASQNNP
jgi:curved DNA-binding protein CbpA